MNLNLNAPPQFNGTPEEQIKQVTRYLFQLQRDLNIALDGVDKSISQSVGQTAQTAAQKETAQAAKSLKALIIKTANFVKQEMDSWTELLEGNYLAISDFGTYREEVSQEITATATDIVNRFNFESTLEAYRARIEELEADNSLLNSYKVQTEQYTKTGLLYYDEYDVPVYGYAVGEVLTRVTVNGDETVRREDLLATWSAGRMNFWQGGQIIAYYANNKLYVLRGEFIESVQIGDWVITTNDGNFDIDYAGEEE